jgi:hypothetical protein
MGLVIGNVEEDTPYIDNPCEKGFDGYFYSGIRFNTPRLAAVQITQRLRKFGIKPDGIMNLREGRGIL